MDKNRPLVSVIIPYYNGERFVVEAVQSVLRQTIRAAVEIIIVDDGSPIPLPDVVQELGVRVVFQLNQGVAAARNRGLAEADGQFIAFLDQDDVWEQDFLAVLQDSLAADQRLGAAFGSGFYTTANTNERVAALAPPPAFRGRLICDPAALLAHGNPIHSPSQALFCREALDAAGGFATDLQSQGADDWDLWIRLTECGYCLQHRDQSLVRYRMHAQNTSYDHPAMHRSQRSVLTRHIRRHPRPIRRQAIAAYFEARGRDLYRQNKVEGRKSWRQALRFATSPRKKAILLLKILLPEDPAYWMRWMRRAWTRMTRHGPRP